MKPFQSSLKMTEKLILITLMHDDNAIPPAFSIFFFFFFLNLKAAKKKINLTPKSSGEDGNFWRKKQNKTKQKNKNKTHTKKNITGHHAMQWD